MAIHAGDIYWMRGGPKPRPVVVISREEFNRGKYVVGVLLTTSRLQDRWALPNCVRFQRGEAGLTSECVAQAESMSQIVIAELDIENGWIGSIGEAKLDALVAAVGYVIAADCRRS